MFCTAIQARRDNELYLAGLETFGNESFWGNSFTTYYLGSIELIKSNYNWENRIYENFDPTSCNRKIDWREYQG